MLDCIQNVSLQMDTTLFLKFKQKHLPDSKYRWNLHFKLSKTLKLLSKASAPVWFLRIFVHKINIDVSIVEFIFSKSPCFLHIFINNFRRIRLKYENLPLRDILFQIFKQHSDRKSFIPKTFNRNALKMKTSKSYLGKSNISSCLPIGQAL